LQKRPMILRSLLMEATPYMKTVLSEKRFVTVFKTVFKTERFVTVFRIFRAPYGTLAVD